MTGIKRELARIADALEGLYVVFDALVPAPPEPAETCPHPPEQRVDFGVTDGRADWHCQACGYRSVPVNEAVHG